MNLLFYADVTEGIGEKIKIMIESLVSQDHLEFYYGIETLARRLRRPTNDLSVAVLLAANGRELLDLLSIADLLRDLRIILILPDRHEDTVSKGHMLRPRFLSYIDSDFKDVYAVLQKCLEVYMSEKSEKVDCSIQGIA